MGQALSRVRGAVFTRTKQRFNIEDRTDKLLSREKLDPAPKYESDAKFLQDLKTSHPEIMEEIEKKDDKLLKRLEDVYVTSKDPESYDPMASYKRKDNVDRPFPKSPFSTSGFLGAGIMLHNFADEERLKKIPGKIMYSQVEEVLNNYQTDPLADSNNPREIAMKYDIDQAMARNLTKHFRIFDMIEANKKVLETIDDPYSPQPDWVDPGEEAKKLAEVRKQINIKEKIQGDKPALGRGDGGPEDRKKIR